MEPGSPFGQSITALVVVYLHYAHAIGLERLCALMAEMFALTISEGAISNMLARSREPLVAAASTIQQAVVASEVVASDETSARVNGQTWWEWVFVGTLAVLHVIRPSCQAARNSRIRQVRRFLLHFNPDRPAAESRICSNFGTSAYVCSLRAVTIEAAAEGH